jgi:hypothetical protein
MPPRLLLVTRLTPLKTPIRKLPFRMVLAPYQIAANTVEHANRPDTKQPDEKMRLVSIDSIHFMCRDFPPSLPPPNTIAANSSLVTRNGACC